MQPSVTEIQEPIKPVEPYSMEEKVEIVNEEPEETSVILPPIPRELAELFSKIPEPNKEDKEDSDEEEEEEGDEEEEKRPAEKKEEKKEAKPSYLGTTLSAAKTASSAVTSFVSKMPSAAYSLASSLYQGSPSAKFFKERDQLLASKNPVYPKDFENLVKTWRAIPEEHTKYSKELFESIYKLLKKNRDIRTRLKISDREFRGEINVKLLSLLKAEERSILSETLQQGVAEQDEQKQTSLLRWGTLGVLGLVGGALAVNAFTEPRMDFTPSIDFSQSTVASLPTIPLYSGVNMTDLNQYKNPVEQSKREAVEKGFYWDLYSQPARFANTMFEYAQFGNMPANQLDQILHQYELGMKDFADFKTAVRDATNFLLGDVGDLVSLFFPEVKGAIRVAKAGANEMNKMTDKLDVLMQHLRSWTGANKAKGIYWYYKLGGKELHQKLFDQTLYNILPYADHSTSVLLRALNWGKPLHDPTKGKASGYTIGLHQKAALSEATVGPGTVASSKDELKQMLTFLVQNYFAHVQQDESSQALIFFSNFPVQQEWLQKWQETIGSGTLQYEGFLDFVNRLGFVKNYSFDIRKLRKQLQTKSGLEALRQSAWQRLGYNEKLMAKFHEYLTKFIKSGYDWPTFIREVNELYGVAAFNRVRNTILTQSTKFYETGFTPQSLVYFGHQR